MKQKTAQDENTSTQQTVDGPGSQLRKARERQGLDQSKLAAQLHLSQSKIQALEWDDYDNLPAAVFVQGYLRNYARLLGVDEDAVIRSYQELNPEVEKQPLPRNQPDEVARELHSDHRLVRLVSWLVVLVLGVLVFFWWQGRMDSTEIPAPAAQQHDEIEPGFPIQQQDEPGLSPAESLSPISESEQQSASPSPDRMLPATDGVPAMDQPVTETLTVELDRTAEPEPVLETETSPSAEVEPELATGFESQTPVATASTGVVFEFTGPCWVEVRDATGQARISGVKRGGVRRSLDPQLGPFKVVIGDINAVRLSVNGEAYDLRRHARGKVARFTLDPSRL